MKFFLHANPIVMYHTEWVRHSTFLMKKAKRKMISISEKIRNKMKRLKHQLLHEESRLLA